MRNALMLAAIAVIAVLIPVLTEAQERPKVGGFEQIPPGTEQQTDIGEAWGHRSMTYGMMNLMSGITMQAATILRSGKADQEMLNKIAGILDHIAAMLNYWPAYMTGTKPVDSHMIQEMHNMLQDLEKMRREINAR